MRQVFPFFFSFFMLYADCMTFLAKKGGMDIMDTAMMGLHTPSPECHGFMLPNIYIAEPFFYGQKSGQTSQCLVGGA